MGFLSANTWGRVAPNMRLKLTARSLMRLSPYLFICATLLGCSSNVAPAQPLDGVWRLATAFSPLDPRRLTLTQRDSTVTGTGSALGVDVPIAVAVTGTAALPLVVMTFRYADLADGTLTARYSATLESDSLLVGQVVYDSAFGGMTHSLTFAKQ